MKSTALQTTENTQGVKFNENLLLFILAAIQFAHVMDFVIMMPMNPVLQEVFHIDNKKFSLLVSSYSASAGIFGFLAFFFIDRFDRRKALLFLFAGFAIGTFFCAVAQSYSLFLLARILSGIFGGILSGIVLAVVGDVFPEARRGKATGIVMSAFSVASVIGIPVGYELAIRINWHFPFYILAAISTIVLILAYKVLPSMSSHIDSSSERNPLKMLQGIFNNSNLVWALLFIFVLMMAGFTVIPFISDYMAKNVGFSKEDISMIYFFGGLATVFTGPLIGRLADKFGKQRVFIVVALISLIPVLLITNLPPVSKVIAYMVTTTFFIFFGGRFIPAMSIITSSVQKSQRGGFMSINSSIQSLSSAIAALVGGVILVATSTGQITNFYAVGIVAAIFSVLAILISFKIKQVS
ncbi:MAG TPA: MFS transporter [Cytophagaceae bacterium]